MANQPKVIKLGLEELVLDGRKRGLSLVQIRDECNEELERRARKAAMNRGKDGKAQPKAPESVSKPAIERYLRTLDKATVPVAHQPQVAQENAQVAIEFGARLARLDALLGQWIEQADSAVTPMRGVLWDPYLQEPADPNTARESAERMADGLADALELADADTARAVQGMIGAVVVMVPDWQARIGVAKEMRQHLEAYANLLDRIHNASQVQAFQRAVVEAIREASPEVAHEVLAKLKTLQQARSAALLGADIT